MTNFEEDHLDHHATMEEYFKSKARLFSHESGQDSWIGRMFEMAANLEYELPENAK